MGGETDVRGGATEERSHSTVGITTHHPGSGQIGKECRGGSKGNSTQGKEGKGQYEERSNENGQGGWRLEQKSPNAFWQDTTR